MKTYEDLLSRWPESNLVFANKYKVKFVELVGHAMVSLHLQHYLKDFLGVYGLDRAL